MTTWLLAAAAVVCLVLRWAYAGRHIDATPLLFALGPLNAAAFSLRRAIAWSRGPVAPQNEAKGDLFSFAGAGAGAGTGAGTAPLYAREAELRARHRLTPLFEASTAHVYRENLYVLDVLERYAAAVRPRGPTRALDVGSQDFRYAFALSRWLGGSDATLTGIEIDGHRVYADLSSRKDHAESYARAVDEGTVRYEVKDFLAHEDDAVDVITFFFPFVLEYALVRWGLPRRCFLPEQMFRHARALLRPGGVVIVMNHTEAERRRQVELLAETGFEVVSSRPVACALVDYADDVPERSLTIARARGPAPAAPARA